MSVGRSAAHQTDASDRHPEAFRHCVGALLLLTSIFFLNFMARIAQAPLMPAIEKELGLSHSAAGALFLTVSAGYFVTLLLSGFVSARLNHHRTIVLSSMLVGAALLATAHSRSVWGLHLGLLSVGLAAGLYLPSAIASLMGFVSSRHWGKAIAIHEVAPNLSFVLAPLFAEAVLVFFSWDARAHDPRVRIPGGRRAFRVVRTHRRFRRRSPALCIPARAVRRTVLLDAGGAL